MITFLLSILSWEKMGRANLSMEIVAWPALRGKAARRNYWWMQDGASPHCTNAAKKFLLEKFKERVISRGTILSADQRTLPI